MINENILKNSECSYPDLLKKFNNFDESLKLEDYVLVYYGFGLQKDYLETDTEMDLLGLQRYKTYEELIIKCNEALKSSPVSLMANYSMAFALRKLGKPRCEWGKYRIRYQWLVRAVLSGGNGLSREASIKVLYVSDEYNLLYHWFHISEIISQTLTDNYCDIMEVKLSEDDSIREIFFDVSRKFERV